MSEGRFAYRKQLEQLRSKLSENRPSPFKHKSSDEQLKEVKQEGLMRPSKQPEVQPEAGMSKGIGMAIAEALADDAPEYMEGSSPKPQLKPYEIPTDDSRVGFVAKLIESESSGDSEASYTDKKGRSYVGHGQFGKSRLKDYMNATGEKFSQQEFKKSPELQAKVMEWHIHTIDKAISELDEAGKWDRDGLRAVAHLGGTAGMKKFVKSNGKYNPSDELGTSLWKYYNKFKS